MAKMIVIGDAGGTSTHWRVIQDEGISQFQTRGMNAMHQSIDPYMAEVSNLFSTYTKADEVFFYVAGLQQDNLPTLQKSFAQLFPEGAIHVENDLLAAARATCGHQSGWVGILGTGANLAHYNGQEVYRSIPPLGYLLGDEGSGAYLGKQLIRKYLRKQLPETIQLKFYHFCKQSEEQLLKSIYQDPDPKDLFAQSTYFMKEHGKDPFIYQLIYDSFLAHFKVFLVDKKDELPIHYVGSIAYHFSDHLRQAANDAGVAIGQIAELPIAGLTIYHQHQANHVSY